VVKLCKCLQGSSAKIHKTKYWIQRQPRNDRPVALGIALQYSSATFVSLRTVQKYYYPNLYF